VWDPKTPNIKLCFAFETPEDALSLRSVILSLSAPIKKSGLPPIATPIATPITTHQRPRNFSVASASTAIHPPSVTSSLHSQASSSNTTIVDRRIYLLRGRTSHGDPVPAHFQGLFIVRKHYDWEYADLYLGKILELPILHNE
jgi:hypothetical protein